MGDEHEAEGPPRSRAVLLLALLALAVVAALAFGRVFRGPGTALRLALAAAVCVLLAGALERQPILLSALASAVGLAAAVGLMVFPETTWHGLPTATTLRTAVRFWDAVGRAAASEVAPALPLRPLILAALTAVWSAAFAAHALAARARSPFLAILPPAALLAFATLLMEDGPRPIYVVPFLIAVLVVLFADGVRRIGQWGPVTLWQGQRGAAFARSTSTRGARRVALACLAVALFVPGVLPGLGSRGLVDVQADSGGLGVSIDPLVDIRPRLLNQRPVTLFNVHSRQAFYWRSVALEHFDGRTWWPSERLEPPSGVPVQSGAPLPSNSAFPATAVGQAVVQRVTIAELADPWLPAAYEPREVNAPGQLRYDPRTGTLISSDGLTPAYTYTVVSSAVSPTSEELDAMSPVTGPQVEPLTRLPADLPPEIDEIARQLTEGETTAYRKILAIQEHLRKFRYDLNVPPTQGVNDLLHFLMETKAGYCQQFAGTMAVLLRTLGIPARVAVGFTPGVLRNGAWRVSTHESHAWVEVLFPTYGWLAFEPTPTRYNPGTTSYALVQRSLPRGGQGLDCELTLGPGPVRQQCPTTGRGNQVPEPGPRPTGRQEPSVGGGQPAPPRAQGQALGTWILLGLGILVLLLAMFPGAKIARRRLALARARGPRQRVLAAYRLMADRAADVGLARLPSETFQEYRSRLQERIPSLDGDLDGLSRLAGRAAYAQEDVTPADAHAATSAARATIRQITRAAGGPRSVAGWFRVDASSFRRWTAG